MANSPDTQALPFDKSDFSTLWQRHETLRLEYERLCSHVKKLLSEMNEKIGAVPSELVRSDDIKDGLGPLCMADQDGKTIYYLAPRHVEILRSRVASSPAALAEINKLSALATAFESKRDRAHEWLEEHPTTTERNNHYESLQVITQAIVDVEPRNLAEIALKLQAVAREPDDCCKIRKHVIVIAAQAGKLMAEGSL